MSGSGHVERLYQMANRWEVLAGTSTTMELFEKRMMQRCARELREELAALAPETSARTATEEAQWQSFAYGNCNIDNPAVTREMVAGEARKMAGEREMLSDIMRKYQDESGAIPKSSVIPFIKEIRSYQAHAEASRSLEAPAPDLRLTREQVEKALDSAIGAVIDPVPDTVPRYIVRNIQMERLTEELNKLLAAAATTKPDELVEACEAWIEGHRTVSSGCGDGKHFVACKCGELFNVSAGFYKHPMTLHAEHMALSLAAFVRSHIAQARLEEAEWWHEGLYACENNNQACCERISELRAARGARRGLIPFP